MDGLMTQHKATTSEYTDPEDDRTADSALPIASITHLCPIAHASILS